MVLSDSKDIDIAVSPMKMTAEREEVIDFIAPYYDQTGILIGMLEGFAQFDPILHFKFPITIFSHSETRSPNIAV